MKTREPDGPAITRTAMIYTRVSSHEQARGGVSLDAQLEACRRQAAANGWVIGAEYRDVLSGMRDDRPGYQRMLYDLRRARERRDETIVVVARLDRLGRRMRERLRCHDELAQLGVPIHSALEGGVLSPFVYNILSSLAEEESRVHGERVALSIRHIANRGWYPPGKTPWGYRLRPATPAERAQGAPASVRIVDPESAPAVQEAYRRAAAGDSIHAVHRWVTGLPDDQRGRRVMTYHSTRRVLKSPVYIGRQPEGEDEPLARPAGRWPQLVTDAMWSSVQRQIASHSRVSKHATGRYLLTGFLRCPMCGTRMCARARSRQGRTYRCQGSVRRSEDKARACTFEVLGEAVDRATLEEVQRLLSGFGADPGDGEDGRSRWAALTQDRRDVLDYEAQREGLRKQVDRATSRLKEASALLASGDLGRHGYDLLREELLEELRVAEEALSRLVAPDLDGDLPGFDDMRRLVDTWAEAIGTGDILRQRDVLRDLVETVEPVRVGRGSYAVRIG